MTTEERLETALVKWVKSLGGTALKGATNFDTGYPDRTIYLPGAAAHVEVKGTSTRYHLTEKQKLWAGRIIASGMPYYIVENDAQLEQLKTSVFKKRLDTEGKFYNLNGFDLILTLDSTRTKFEVYSRAGSAVKRIMSGFVSDSLPNTIYRIFVCLEESFPNTNYCDI